MKTWDETPLEKFAAEIWESKPLRVAYLMGQIDSAMFEIFGHVPDADDAPDEARQCAQLMMEALLSDPKNMESIIARAHAIANEWRTRRELH